MKNYIIYTFIIFLFLNPATASAFMQDGSLSGGDIGGYSDTYRPGEAIRFMSLVTDTASGGVASYIYFPADVAKTYDPSVIFPGYIASCTNQTSCYASITTTVPTTPGTYEIWIRTCGHYYRIAGAPYYCSGDGHSIKVVAPVPGTVLTSSNIPSSWTITGPATITGSGTSQSSPLEPPGTYTVTWGAVPGYTTPASQSLTLTNGGTITFNGTYSANSCAAATVSNCNLPLTASGSSAGGSCSSGYAGSCNYLCTNGAWSLNSNSCTPASCTLPWGNTIANGVSVTAFQSPSVTSPATCVANDPSETRTCTNGTLSGSYTNSNCVVLQPSATISANPTRVRPTPPGNTSTISWTLSNTSCTATRNGVAWNPGPSFSSSNSYLDTITRQTVYTITCTGVTPQSVTVNVLAGFNEF